MASEGIPTIYLTTLNKKNFIGVRITLSDVL
jgi:hypothetical protein